MFYLITILYTLFWTPPSEDITVSYNSEMDVIVINGVASNEAESNYDVSVYYGEVSASPKIPQVIGSLEQINSQIYYKSKYGFSVGASYTVIVSLNSASAGLKNEYRFVLTIPKLDLKPTAYVKTVYPTTSRLPMNQLKFYIEFSKPMKTGNAFDYIRLYNLSEGKLEEDAFLIMADELWDIDKKRLTVLFDPGRIKRGIQPNLQLGLPLVEGQNYKLVIDKDWLDVNGTQLTTSYEKIFEVIAVDRIAPNKNNWKITIPEQVTKNPIIINFNESMDAGLMQTSLIIVNKNNKEVKGKVMLNNHESLWLFTPKKPWIEGDYKIVVDAWLEDLAGNSLRRKFDVNLNDMVDHPKNIKEVIIPFKIN